MAILAQEQDAQEILIPPARNLGVGHSRGVGEYTHQLGIGNLESIDIWEINDRDPAIRVSHPRRS